MTRAVEHTIADLPHARATLTTAGVATLSIENAGKLNILGTAVIQDLIKATEHLAALPDVRVLILRGASDRAFVAGADISEMATLDHESAKTFISTLRTFCNGMRHFPVPVIARIPAWALGGGLELAVACDLRIAADTAQFGMPEVKVGIPSVIHAALLPRLIGAGNAAWLLLAGELIDAPRALAWGLVNEIVPREKLDDTVHDLAQRLARLGPVVLRQQKKLLRSWEGMSVDDAIEASVAEFGSAFDTGEPQQFMNQFLAEKQAAKAGGQAGLESAP